VWHVNPDFGAGLGDAVVLLPLAFGVALSFL
jgi:hypothetical protein